MAKGLGAAVAAAIVLGWAASPGDAAAHARRDRADVTQGRRHAHHPGRRVDVSGRWFHGDGPPPPSRERLPASPYEGVSRPEDVDHGHLSTQATAGGPYRTEVPLPLTRAEPPLAPSPYIGR